MDPGRVCPQNSSRPAGSVRTSALLCWRGPYGDEPLSPCPTGRRTAHPYLGGIELAVGEGGTVQLTLDGYGYRWLRVVGPDSRRLLRRSSGPASRWTTSS